MNPLESPLISPVGRQSEESEYSSAPREWGFAGWGTTDSVLLAKLGTGGLVSTRELESAVSVEGGLKSLEAAEAKAQSTVKHVALGPLLATSIAGNDLLSSCLYVGGICAGSAGKMAPLSLVFVSVMLYFFRFVYGEVITAMPVNGGSYTALSNITSKRVAALAACLSLISYVATAVVSAVSAVAYLQLVAPPLAGDTGSLLGPIVVLGVFAGLNLLGVAESAGVACAMFVTHIVCLVVLALACFVWACRDGWTLFRANLGEPYPDGQNWFAALYFGYWYATQYPYHANIHASPTQHPPPRATHARHSPAALHTCWLLV